MNEVRDHELYREVGRRIHNARLNFGVKMSQAKLARLLGVTRASVSNIERGDQRISLAMLYEVSHHLEIRLTELLPTVDRFFASEINLDGKRVKVSSGLRKTIEGVLNNE